MSDVLDGFSWHSAVGASDKIKIKRVKSMVASDSLLSKFIKVGSDKQFLVHKATKALWAFSEDGSHIEPVFDEDVLTEDEI